MTLSLSRIFVHSKVDGGSFIKDALSDLRQFLATATTLKMMKNYFLLFVSP